MANKMYNGILETILLKCEHHKSIDFFIAITSLANQIHIKPSTTYDENGNKRKTEYIFIVPCVNNTVHCLWTEMDSIFPKLMNKTTIYKCVEEFIELGIIKYNVQYNGFQIMDMEKMVVKKDKGFTKIRDFFFTDTFLNIPFAEKRIIMYIAYSSGKTSVSQRFKKEYGADVVVNLNNCKSEQNQNVLNWLSVCRTDNVFYARKLISSLLTNYVDLFEDITLKLRKNKFEKIKGISYQIISGKTTGVNVSNLFFFDLNKNIKEQDYVEEKECELLANRFPSLNEKIDTIFGQHDIKAVISTKIAILRRLNRFFPYLQDLIIGKIAKRLCLFFENEELPIRSMDGFIAHMLKTNRTVNNVAASN